MVKNVEIQMPVYGLYYNSPVDVSEEELDILSRGLEEKMRARGLRGLVTLIALQDEGSAQVDDGNFADTMRFYADLRHEISNGVRSFLVSGEHAKL